MKQIKSLVFEKPLLDLYDGHVRKLLNSDNHFIKTVVIAAQFNPNLLRENVATTNTQSKLFTFPFFPIFIHKTEF